MQDIVFVFVGALAATVSAVALAERFDAATRLVGSLLGALLWAVWSLHATNVESFTNGGGIVTRQYLSLSYLGIGLALVLATGAVVRAFDVVGEATDGDLGDSLG